jgi:hypothetical protein
LNQCLALVNTGSLIQSLRKGTTNEQHQLSFGFTFREKYSNASSA